jgi:peptide chain release factor 2
MRQRNSLDRSVTEFKRLQRDYDDALTLIELGEAENDLTSVSEGESALQRIDHEAQRRSIEAMLSGEADAMNTYIEVHAGAGGTESQDWASMLARMYVRWAERRGYKVKMVDESPGEEAGIKSATFEIEGENAYGWLKTEAGVHRLVRISPFDSNARRHTSFASVTVYPVIDDTIDVDINPSDVDISYARASGAGGQHVKRLKARLYEMELKRREEKASAEQAAKTDIGWGHQIRSYVLQPYQLVKDLRTGAQSTNPDEVLDGDIDQFIEAALSQRIKGGSEAVTIEDLD